MTRDLYLSFQRGQSRAEFSVWYKSMAVLISGPLARRRDLLGGRVTPVDVIDETILRILDGRYEAAADETFAPCFARCLKTTLNYFVSDARKPQRHQKFEAELRDVFYRGSSGQDAQRDRVVRAVDGRETARSAMAGRRFGPKTQAYVEKLDVYALAGASEAEIAEDLKITPNNLSQIRRRLMKIFEPPASRPPKKGNR